MTLSLLQKGIQSCFDVSISFNFAKISANLRRAAKIANRFMPNAFQATSLLIPDKKVKL